MARARRKPNEATMRLGSVSTLNCPVWAQMIGAVSAGCFMWQACKGAKDSLKTGLKARGRRVKALKTVN